jgi:hypothetical protein
MEWIFLDLGIGSLVLLAAQLLEYLVESKGVRHKGLHIGVFASDVPPGDTQPATELPAWYDQAA